MNFPNDRKYATSDLWAMVEGGIALVGVSDYAQNQLGEVVYIQLPEVGDVVEAEDALGSIESVKTISDLKSPVSGTVVAVNEGLADEPSQINGDPYGNWIAKIEMSAAEEIDALLDAATYEAQLG